MERGKTAGRKRLIRRNWLACAVLLAAALLCAQTPKPLPAGVSILLRLETTLDSQKTEEGDLIVATVIKDAKYKGKVVIPANATIRGRFRGMDRKPSQTALGIEFTELEVAGVKTRVALELERIISQLPKSPRPEDGAWSGRPTVRDAASTMIVNEPRGTGIFVVAREQFKLARLEMVWVTLKLE